MEHWININQKRTHEWNISTHEAILCSFYSNEHKWVRTRIPDENGDYLCIAITKLIKELPLIGKSKKNFSKSLNSLTKLNIFEKIIDEDNQRTVFYRMNYLYKSYWKYPTLVLASDLKTKNIGIVNIEEMKQVLPNGNSMSKLTQVFPYILEVCPNGNEVCPNGNLSNKQSNKQSNKHNHREDEKDDSLKNTTKENLAKKEFDRIIEIYPYTVNNSPKILALAFGSYLNLSQIQKADLFKAVKNYSKTKQVKDHIAKGTTNFIQNLNNFITKSFTEFIHGLPEKFAYAEEFEPKKNPNGAASTFADVTVFNGPDKDSVSLKPYIAKFEQVKRILENDENFDVKNCDDYDDSKMKEIFDAKEYEIFSKRMGWLQFAYKYTTVQLADTMNDYLGER